MPFERTSFPGLTVFGSVEVPSGTPAVDLSSSKDWQAQVDESISFPTGLVDDVFLHVGVGYHCPSEFSSMVMIDVE